MLEVTVGDNFKHTKEMYVWEIVCNVLRPVTKINPADSERWEKQPSGGLDKVLPAALFYCQLNRVILEEKPT